MPTYTMARIIVTTPPHSGATMRIPQCLFSGITTACALHTHTQLICSTSLVSQPLV